MAVPGGIYNSLSIGTNNLLKSSAAAPVTSYIDVLHILGLEDKSRAVRRVVGRNDNEQRLLDLMQSGNSDGNQILERSGLSASQFNQALTMLEIGGKIRPLGANHWGIV